MIVSSVCDVGVLWIGLWIAERELDNMLDSCLVSGRYLSVINTGTIVQLHHPAGGPIAGEVTEQL